MNEKIMAGASVSSVVSLEGMSLQSAVTQGGNCANNRSEVKSKSELE